MTNSRKLVLGVDPGLTGALALIDAADVMNPRIIEVIDAPVILDRPGGRNDIDRNRLALWIDGYARDIAFAVIEDVDVMTGSEGRVSMFRFGEAFGDVKGVISGCMVKTYLVKPAVWKGMMGLGRDKKSSNEKAAQKFPAAAEKFKRVKDHGRAEAALLAAFGAERLL